MKTHMAHHAAASLRAAIFVSLRHAGGGRKQGRLCFAYFIGDGPQNDWET